jgi:hypothetical protein
MCVQGDLREDKSASLSGNRKSDATNSHIYMYYIWSRDCGWLAGWLAGRPGFDSRQCKIFLFTTASRPTLEAHPASYPIGTGALSQRGKAAGKRS